MPSRLPCKSSFTCPSAHTFSKPPQTFTPKFLYGLTTYPGTVSESNKFLVGSTPGSDWGDIQNIGNAGDLTAACPTTVSEGWQFYVSGTGYTTADDYAIAAVCAPKPACMPCDQVTITGAESSEAMSMTMYTKLRGGTDGTPTLHNDKPVFRSAPSYSPSPPPSL